MSFFIKENTVYVNIEGEIKPTRNPTLIGLAVLDSLERNPEPVNQLTERFTMFLENGNYRKTPERYAVLENICDNKEPFNVRTVHQTLSPKFRLTLATVYNTVELLLECNIIKRTNENQNGELFKTTYFELN